MGPCVLFRYICRFSWKRKRSQVMALGSWILTYGWMCMNMWLLPSTRAGSTPELGSGLAPSGLWTSALLPVWPQVPSFGDSTLIFLWEVTPPPTLRPAVVWGGGQHPSPIPVGEPGMQAGKVRTRWLVQGGTWLRSVQSASGSGGVGNGSSLPLGLLSRYHKSYLRHRKGRAPLGMESAKRMAEWEMESVRRTWTHSWRPCIWPCLQSPNLPPAAPLT